MKRYDYDDKRLEERSNELLDKHFELLHKHSSEQSGFDSTNDTTAAEIALMGGKLTPKGFAEVGGVEKAEQLRAEGIARDDYLQDPKEFERHRAREQIIAAIDNNNRNEAARIAGSDYELLCLAATFKRRPGQQKLRPNDYSDVKRALFDDLWNQVTLLRDLWKRNEIEVVTRQGELTGPKPVAIRIVARRAGKLLDIDDLEQKLTNWDKNISKRRQGH
jgi:hypothetical protein